MPGPLDKPQDALAAWEAGMIDLYTWSTPNGRKVSIMLEECGLRHSVHSVDITKDEQFRPEFLAISPNNKIPAIVDRDNGHAVFESGAILIYLAERTGQFLPAQPLARSTVLEWLMFQMGGVGPMFGQTHHFTRFAKEQVPYAIARFGAESKRLYGVLDRRLAQVPYLAGADYSIADIAAWPWVARFEWHGLAQGLDEFANVKRWYQAIAARPGVQRGYDVPSFGQQIPTA